MTVADKEITFFIPCYNEEDNIRNTLQNIKDACKNLIYEIIVVNDGSTDSTLQKVEYFIADNPVLDIKIYTNNKNLGLGFSYFKYSLLANGKHYILINGDNVEPVETISEIISHRGEADMIIPFFGDDDKRSINRKIISAIFTRIINLISFTKVKYYNGPVLHYTKNVQEFRSTTFGYGYQAELICKLILLNYSYLNVSVKNSDRQFGTTKAFSIYNFLSVTNSALNIFLGTLSSIIRKILKIDQN